MSVFNHDLLLNKGDVEGAEQAYPHVAEFLDWPELRKAFKPIDLAADASKRASRRAGIVGVICGVVGLWLAASEPLFKTRPMGWGDEIVLALVILLLGVAALLFGSSVLRGPHKDQWLHNRAATERLRQLHFQWLARRALAIAGATKAQKRELKDERNRLLALLLDDLEPGKAPIVEDIIKDLGGEHTWQVDRRAHGSAAKSQPELEQLFDALAKLRIQHQAEYAGKKLAEGHGLWPAQPKGQERRLSLVGGLLTFVIILLHLLLAILVPFFTSEAHQLGPWLQLLAMIAALTVLGIRVLEDGLRPKLEVMRYQRYQGEVAEVKRQFEAAADADEKVAALERLEELGYRELRDFLTEHSEASFVL